MATAGIRGKSAIARLCKPNYLPTFVALLVVIAAGLFAEQQNRAIYAAKMRATVVAKLNPIRAKLEANINGDIQLVRGLMATIATEPGMDQKRFTELSQNLFKEQSRFRSIAAAPDLIVSLVYPLKGNEKALGLNYRKTRSSVLRHCACAIRAGWFWPARWNWCRAGKA